MDLRKNIVGTWNLDAFVAKAAAPSTAPPIYPLTENPNGLILYSADGYMSSQLCKPGESGPPGYLAYCGRYYITVENGKEVLQHEMLVNNVPEWVGQLQRRAWSFEEGGNVLVLAMEEPVEMGNEMRTVEVRWRKANDNSQGSPPTSGQGSIPKVREEWTDKMR